MAGPPSPAAVTRRDYCCDRSGRQSESARDRASLRDFQGSTGSLDRRPDSGLRSSADRKGIRSSLSSHRPSLGRRVWTVPGLFWEFRPHEILDHPDRPGHDPDGRLHRGNAADLDGLAPLSHVSRPRQARRTRPGRRGGREHRFPRIIRGTTPGPSGTPGLARSNFGAPARLARARPPTFSRRRPREARARTRSQS
jgi:hypothetical protein